jgi:uncharacterized protein
MLYRMMGKSGCRVSVLGFGCMRFPVVNSTGSSDIFDPEKSIDEEQSEKMIRFALDKGVNYFDSGYPYHGGKSETFLGRMTKTEREKVILATKLPTWLIQKREDFIRFFDEQLQRLDTGYIDFYLLHGLNRPLWQFMSSLGIFDFLDKIQAAGRALHVGFSFHDDVNIFKEIVDAYPWAMCQIQYNYFDENHQAGKEGLLYAASKGLGVVIMEPLRGGKLAEKVPASIQSLWDTAPVKRSPAAWALRWVWNHPEVSTVLSGMSSLPQVMENVGLADQANAGTLSDEEFQLIHRVRNVYDEMLKIKCTGCAYCMPCPNGVDIPYNFNLYNNAFMFDDAELSTMIYNKFSSPQQRASNCQECGECEEVCPQHLNIMDQLKEVDRELVRS